MRSYSFRIPTISTISSSPFEKFQSSTSRSRGSLEMEYRHDGNSPLPRDLHELGAFAAARPWRALPQVAARERVARSGSNFRRWRSHHEPLAIGEITLPSSHVKTMSLCDMACHFSARKERKGSHVHLPKFASLANVAIFGLSRACGDRFRRRRGRMSLWMSFCIGCQFAAGRGRGTDELEIRPTDCDVSPTQGHPVAATPRIAGRSLTTSATRARGCGVRLFRLRKLCVPAVLAA